MGTHKRRESGQKWEGYDQMQLVLENLASPKGTSANRVKAVASVALQYAKVGLRPQYNPNGYSVSDTFVELQRCGPRC